MSYMACSCDYDAPSFYVRETRKARKRHECDECRGPIDAGEAYEHVRGKWEYVDSFKTCSLCIELRQWAVISVPCFCWAHQSLHENIREMVDEVRRDVPRGFVFEWGRRMIAIQRRRYGAHWPRPIIRKQEAERLAAYRAAARAEARA